MRLFKQSRAREKQLKTSSKGLCGQSVLRGRITVTAVFCVMWKGCWVPVMVQKCGLEK